MQEFAHGLLGPQPVTVTARASTGPSDTNVQKVLRMRLTPNDHHQRCEPAAEGFRGVSELNCWLASAEWCG